MLVNYGFCFANNLYDSYPARFRLDLVFSKKQQFRVRELLEPTNQINAVQIIRFKHFQFNSLLMSYLRTSLKEDFYENKQNKSSKHVRITQPLDLEFEKHCIEYYLGVVNYLFANA